MKLYLSSFHLGKNPKALKSLFSIGNRILVIPNALDFSTDYKRLSESLNLECNDLKSLGLEPEILDLKEYFGKDINKLKSVLRESNGTWVIGGNVFVLRRAMSYSQFDKIIKELPDEFVYASYSAGSCVASPSLKGLELVDNPKIIPNNYQEEIIWEGLNIINYSIAPHYDSDHPESKVVNNVINYYLKNEIAFKAIRDGEVIIEKLRLLNF